MCFMHSAVFPFFISTLDMSRCMVASFFFGLIRHFGDHFIHLLHMGVSAQVLTSCAAS